MHPKSPLLYGILGKKRAFLAEFKCKFEIFQNIHIFLVLTVYLHFGTWRKRREVDTKDNNNYLKTHLPKLLYPFEQIFFQAYFAYTYIFNYLTALCVCVCVCVFNKLKAVVKPFLYCCKLHVNSSFQGWYTSIY